MTVRPPMAALRLLAGAAIFFAGFAAVHAAWIPLKASLAQVLLEHSWKRQKDGEIFKPWPWADTHAVALLNVPRLEIQQVVLAGNSGRNLAFGPTALQGPEGSDPQQRDWIINGHRDTHFRFLQQLQRGDVLRLETARGSREFVVEVLEVIDSRAAELVLEPGLARLSLVTCYPFDAINAGGPLRYVVTAQPLEDRRNQHQRRAVSSG